MQPDQLVQKARSALYASDFTQALALAEPLIDNPKSAISITAVQIAGLALTRLGQLDRAIPLLKRQVEIDPNNAAAWVNLSTAQESADKTDDAIASLTRAVKIDPKRPAAHFNLGLLWVKRQDWEQAQECFGHCSKLWPERSEPYSQRAEALIRLNRCVEAQRVLHELQKRHPLLAIGWSLMGAAHQKLGHMQQAIDCYQKAQKLTGDPAAQAAVHANMATVLKGQDPQLALQYARRAVELLPNFPGVNAILSSVLIDIGEADEAYAVAQKERDEHGNDPFSLSLLARVSSERCDWNMCDDQLAALQESLVLEKNKSAYSFINPFVLLRFPFDPGELKRITIEHASSSLAVPKPITPQMRSKHMGKPRPKRLRIGYFSADFHNHATMYLMAGFFEAHNKDKFEIIGFCQGRYGDRKDDEMRTRAKRAMDDFLCVPEKTDQEIAEIGRDMDLHIAVDLKGYTMSNRLGAFIQRIAPIQIHYIGYPGTLGMRGSIDYLVADPVLIPPKSRQFYTEKIIQVPDSYQVNDRNRVIDPETPSRQELGLPEKAFVFCCFNNNYKITRDTFALWMGLLHSVPDSVLWLLASGDASTNNLKRAAQNAGINPDRVIFSPRTELPKHLARHVHADLFIDNWPCNAHTTASDALWAGLPTLTCAGQTYASRVCASLLTACNLPELITYTPEDYRNKALELARDPQQLSAIKRKLWDSRMNVPLFDTVRFTRHMETAYDMVWKRFIKGLPPDHIIVPPIA